MNYVFLTRKNPESFESLSRVTCKEFLKKFYFSVCMQTLYVTQIILCSISTILNIPATSFFDPNSVTFTSISTIIEIFICIIMTSEVIIHAYVVKSKHYACHYWNFFDLFIILLSAIGFLLFLKDSYKADIGEIFYGLFFVLRNFCFVIRIIFVMKHGSNKLDELSIGLNIDNDEELFFRNFSIAKIKYRYRPTMDVLFERVGEEDDEEKNFNHC